MDSDAQSKRRSNYVIQLVGYKSSPCPFDSIPTINIKELFFKPRTQKRYLSEYRQCLLRPFVRRLINIGRYPTFEYTYLIRDLKNNIDFVNRFFTKGFLNARELEQQGPFKKKNVPKRMCEIVRIATVGFENNKKPVIDIDLTREDYEEDKFFWYIIAFVNGKASALLDTKHNQPFSYKYDTIFKNDVLNTSLRIVSFENLQVMNNEVIGLN